MLHTNTTSKRSSLTDDFKRIKSLDSYMTKFDKLTFKSPIYEYLAFQNLFGDKKYIIDAHDKIQNRIKLMAPKNAEKYLSFSIRRKIAKIIKKNNKN